MAHGTHCHCMMCTVGKKIGMIRDEQHNARDEHNHDGNSHDEACKSCGHTHKEDGRCDRGC